MSPKTPYFSICIPQYNRTEFLLEACRGYASQTFKDFELCISDDCSNDGGGSILQQYLYSSGMRYVYARARSNLGYDGNLRAAIGLSIGKYLLLMGNDDRLHTPRTLAEIHDDLEASGDVAAALTNYHELSTGMTYRRMRQTKVLGSGPKVAIAVFRSYSFVSGVILRGKEARAEATGALDGSEMYQMYLGTRVVARGGRLLAIDRVCIDKDLQIAGQEVDSYRKPRLLPCPIIKRRLPMGRLLEVVGHGIRPCVSQGELEKLMFCVARDLYTYTYPFWGIEYRRIQSWKYALGILWAVSPNEIARTQILSRSRFTMLWIVYFLSCAVSLSVPLNFFDKLRPALYSLAKRSP